MTEKNLQAKQAALQAMMRTQVKPTSLVQYQSRGRVAVIGGNEAAEFAPRLQSPLKAQVILTSGNDEPGVPLVAVGGRPLRISGHLGDFKIELGEEGKPSYECINVDLIIDLSVPAFLQMPLKPLGYLTSDLEELNLSRVLIEVEALVGTFEKPRFFNYEADKCAHARSGKKACTLCVDACPAEAITSLVDKISVDPFLCQGGGICATVCPGGAISYVYPAVEDLLQRIRVLLTTYRQHTDQSPVICLMAEADEDIQSQLPDSHLPMVLEELGSAGLEVWLGALAMGAARVELIATQSTPETVVAALNGQLTTAREILQGLGYSSEVLQLRDFSEWDESGASVMPSLVPAAYAAMGGKRQLAYMAVDHLQQQAQPSLDVIELSTGAPFGTAQVDAGRCTLCLSCVSACPGKALMQGEGLPQLRFIEANCLQCGMCTQTCPEDAISIMPRLLLDREQRNRPVILSEEEPFECISCGKPFATRSVITLMSQKLQGHWMFQNERALQRLQMCEDCRVVDAVQDESAMQAGFEDVTRQ